MEKKYLLSFIDRPYQDKELEVNIERVIRSEQALEKLMEIYESKMQYLEQKENSINELQKELDRAFLLIQNGRRILNCWILLRTDGLRWPWFILQYLWYGFPLINITLFICIIIGILI